MVPAEAYGTQTLYRVMVTGAEGQGSLKLTLRLAAQRRYQAQAADPLGRALWSLDVEDGKGLWLDHRARLYCQLDGAFDLTFLPLGPLPLEALPPLLLGRLPVAPADPAAVALQPIAGDPAGGGVTAQIAYTDPAGRRWTAVLRDGQPLSWGLRQDAAAGPILTWLDSGGWAVLSDRRKGVQVRWRQTRCAEELRAPLAALVAAGRLPAWPLRVKRVPPRGEDRGRTVPRHPDGRGGMGTECGNHLTPLGLASSISGGQGGAFPPAGR